MALPRSYLRGVNLSGAEWGQSFPGVLNQDFTCNSERSCRYFAGKGLSLVRLCLSWERLQPHLRGPLDPQHLDLVQTSVEWARQNGSRVILDIHNYGRYRIGGAAYTIDNLYDGVVKVSGADLADLWTRLSSVFIGDPAVYAYGLMNEPHDMGAADWEQISQNVLAAIRDSGDPKLVMVPGLGWSSAGQWPRNHPSGWISDPAGNFAYEAHTYFDSDNSGTYKSSYDAELSRDSDLANIGRRRLQPFVSWCRANGARAYLGEYGVPADDPRWLAVLENFLQELDAAGLDGTYWAAGEWWGAYPLSVQPKDDFGTEAAQLPVLLRHLAPETRA